MGILHLFLRSRRTAVKVVRHLKPQLDRAEVDVGDAGAIRDALTSPNVAGYLMGFTLEVSRHDGLDEETGAMVLARVMFEITGEDLAQSESIQQAVQSYQTQGGLEERLLIAGLSDAELAAYNFARGFQHDDSDEFYDRLVWQASLRSS